MNLFNAAQQRMILVWRQRSEARRNNHQLQTPDLERRIICHDEWEQSEASVYVVLLDPPEIEHLRLPQARRVPLRVSSSTSRILARVSTHPSRIGVAEMLDRCYETILHDRDYSQRSAVHLRADVADWYNPFNSDRILSPWACGPGAVGHRFG